jgi:5-methylcytosine-specific restriction endonuclease McrA
MDNIEFIEQTIDNLVEKYGDADVFEAFLTTWEPLQTVRDAVDARMAKQSNKRKRNVVRYNHRDLILKADDDSCVYCGESPENPSLLEIDHIQPLEDGGDNTFENMVTSCQPCNKKKGIRAVEDFTFEVLGHPETYENLRIRTKKTREAHIENHYKNASYDEFKDEFERDGKVRGRSRFEMKE